MTQRPQNPPFSGHALVIDGSGTSLFVGILNLEGQWLAHQTVEGAPLETLFATTESCLDTAGLHFDGLSAFVYNTGPGSVLGLRLCAMAIETWSRLYPNARNLFAYNTLQFCAQTIRLDHTLPKEALLVSDWKKGAWNAVRFTSDKVDPTEVVDDATLASYTGPVFHLPQRKGWQKPPSNATTVSLDIHRFPELLPIDGLLTSTDSVELYTAATNTFQKWTPERHRAPV